MEPLDDLQAFMELATSNNQGELSPLEIGIHALKAVPLGKGGRGKRGGLSEYAAKVGKSHQYISQVRDAAEVAKAASQLAGLLDKAQHLAAIHSLPRECWPAACDWLATSSASVKDVQERVAAALAFRSTTNHRKAAASESVPILGTSQTSGNSTPRAPRHPGSKP